MSIITETIEILRGIYTDGGQVFFRTDDEIDPDGKPTGKMWVWVDDGGRFGLEDHERYMMRVSAHSDTYLMLEWDGNFMYLSLSDVREIFENEMNEWMERRDAWRSERDAG